MAEEQDADGGEMKKRYGPRHEKVIKWPKPIKLSPDKYLKWIGHKVEDSLDRQFAKACKNKSNRV